MTLDEAQQRVDQWIRTYGVRYFSELTNMACLTEEVGELARVMARKYWRPIVQKGRNHRPFGGNGRCAVGAHLPGEPNGCEPDGGAAKEF